MNVIYKIIACFIGVTTFIACTNSELINAETSTGNSVEIRIHAGPIDAEITRNGNTYDLSADEKINRLDIFVYDEEGTLFEYMQPQLNSMAGVYVATLQKDVVTDTKKDVFIIANYDASKIDELKTKTSLEMKQLVQELIQKQNGNNFEGIRILSVAELGHNFSADRVMEVNITRIYSKITLKCVCDYESIMGGEVEDPSGGQQTIKPTHVSVEVDSLIHIPQNASVFPALNQSSPNFGEYRFSSAIPLEIGGAVITKMNVRGKETGELRVYDLSVDTPKLLLFPHAEIGKTTLIGLTFKLYDSSSEAPVKVFSKVIEFPIVEYNKNYEIIVLFNSMDKPKTKRLSTRGATVDIFECSYIISSDSF